jgi:hypothetical protein
MRSAPRSTAIRQAPKPMISRPSVATATERTNIVTVRTAPATSNSSPTQPVVARISFSASPSIRFFGGGGGSPPAS